MTTPEVSPIEVSSVEVSSVEVSPSYEDRQPMPAKEESKEEISVVVPPSLVPPTENPVTDDFSTTKPGSRLRHAREQKNFSVQHVADRLYLDANVIKALEADDYEGLPSPVFVRGYLRNYAKLLEIPIDSVLESLEPSTRGKQLVSTAVVPVPTQNSTPTPKNQASSNDSWVKAVTFALIVTSIVFMALWQIYPNNSSQPEDTTEPKVTQLKPPPIQTSLQNGETASSTNSGGYTSTSEGGNNAGNPAATTNPGGTSTMSGGGSEVANNPSATGTTNESGGNTAVPPTSPTPAVPETVTVDANAVKVTVKKEVWVKILDKTNKQLYQNSVKPDQEVAVTGTPPFKVTVGRTEGVIVEYLGQKTDFVALPTRKNKTATVGTPVNP